jgi:hypothetical protein
MQDAIAGEKSPLKQVTGTGQDDECNCLVTTGNRVIIVYCRVPRRCAVGRFSIAFRYIVLLVVATAGAMMMAVAFVFLGAFLKSLFRLPVSALTYQRLVSTPPFPVQIISGLVLGVALSGSTRNRKYGLWIWIVPVVWMLLALATCRPVEGASTSAWQYFFTASWWQLSPSPLRSQWVTAQFMHTVPLFTSLGYTLGAWLRPKHNPQQDLTEQSTAVS